jgi:hypothetical protein
MRFVQIGVAVELHEEVHELQANFFAPLTAEEVAQIRGCWCVAWSRVSVDPPGHAGMGFGPDELDTIACELSAGDADDVERPFETEVAAFVKVVDHKLTNGGRGGHRLRGRRQGDS